MASSSSTLIDSLPYYDKELEQPGLRALALAEVEKEMKSGPKPSLDDPRIAAEVELFKSPSLLSYPSQPLSSDPNLGIDPSKFQPLGVDELKEQDDEEMWKEGLRRVRVGKGWMEGRNQSLSLLSQHGPNAYLIRNYQLESQAKELERELEIWQEKVVEVNRGRRVFQEKTGAHLTALESRWSDLVTSTIQLEMANKALEGEVQMLRRKEEQLRREMEEREGGVAMEE